jgi:hypothetical protein
MIPSFPVAGLMLAAPCVAAPGVDMLGDTLLLSQFSVVAETPVLLTVKGSANAPKPTNTG